MASFRRRGKYWSYRIRVKDNQDEWREYGESGFVTKKEAQLAARQKELEFSSHESYAGMATFEEFSLSWLEHYIKGKVKTSTYRTYKHAITKHGILNFGNYKLCDIKPMMYQKFIDSLMEKGLALNSAKRIHSAINQCMKRAVINGYIIKNPCEHVVMKKLPTKKLKFVEPKYVQEILSYIYKRDYTYGLFFETLFESGMRKGECAALRLDDIDWRNNSLKVDQTLNFHPEDEDEILGSPKTAASTRDIHMRTKYMQKLKTFIKYRTEQKMLVGALYNHELNLIFARDDGSPLPRSTLYNIFKSALEHVGIEKLPIHSTRHTHTVMLMEAGWDMKSISERLGHESIMTTMNIYAHLSENIKQKSIESFDKYMEQQK